MKGSGRSPAAQLWAHIGPCDREAVELHGDAKFAVACGMVLVAKASVARGWLSAADATRIESTVCAGRGFLLKLKSPRAQYTRRLLPIRNAMAPR